jgi:hypothetical protein
MMQLIDRLGISDSVFALAFMWLAHVYGDEATAGVLAAQAEGDSGAEG